MQPVYITCPVCRRVLRRRRNCQWPRIVPEHTRRGERAAGPKARLASEGARCRGTGAVCAEDRGVKVASGERA